MSNTENGAPAALSAMGTTFAERAAFRARMAEPKAVHADEVEDKAVSRASTKARKSAPKKG